MRSNTSISKKQGLFGTLRDGSRRLMKIPTDDDSDDDQCSLFEQELENSKIIQESELYDKPKKEVILEMPPENVDQSNHRAGYYFLVNEYHAKQQESCGGEAATDGAEQKGFLYNTSAVIKEESSSSGQSSSNPLPNPPHTKAQDQQHEVTEKETVRNIVDDDKSWDQIRRQMKDARLVTSLGVQEVCADYIQSKTEEIRKEKIEAARRLEDLNRSNLKRFRKRLSIFG
mmetsp:Transcript_2713/g.4084  ORF Transcript_2713/g.4084 Transcript_2713/m.4084 type:complete len:229 (-) Transcript_2713:75-761(-)|eukprot:CAMPEP_0197248016 /NCGR_PEP_ID=MMETSP1429-20130617/32621_1 /TAXON_ID=49237 /ORGANISM="Chaetoceros  sp., Strain UNC1202" /LENGTH=228 /DNA_ID=CAMNT_0042709083 /DNA_START=64 /DNA_END=750 /DNA_ORIENTATION=-